MWMYIYYRCIHVHILKNTTPATRRYVYVRVYVYHMCNYMLHHYPHLRETRTFIEVKHARASTAAYGCLFLLDASFLLFLADGGKT